LIENLDTEFPKDLIRAIAWCESQWRQFDENGNTFTDGSLNTADRKGPSLDYGLMQINEHTARKFKFDIPRLKIDTKYNLECGVKILQEKYRWVIRKQKSEDWTWMLEAYDLAGHSKLEIAIKAYNGMRRTWVYLNVIQDIQRDKPWIEYIK
jgi:soluble lytic murein transglycosylase-like protein